MDHLICCSCTRHGRLPEGNIADCTICRENTDCTWPFLRESYNFRCNVLQPKRQKGRDDLRSLKLKTPLFQKTGTHCVNVLITCTYRIPYFYVKKNFKPWFAIHMPSTKPNTKFIYFLIIYSDFCIFFGVICKCCCRGKETCAIYSSSFSS